MALSTIFCPKCNTLILDAEQCHHCHWRRPVVLGDVGKPVWAVALEVKLPRQESHPIAVGDTVYFSTDNGQIIALDAMAVSSQDSIKWRYQFDQRYRCHGVCGWGEFLLAGTEYTGGFPNPPGALVVLSAGSGEEVWRYPLEGASLSVPIVRGDTAFFTVNTGWLYAVDLANRREMWRKKVDEPWSWSPAAPLLAPTNLFILPGRNDHLVAFDAERGELAWTFSAEGWFSQTPALIDGFVYARCWDRHLYALNAQTGQKIWQQKAPRDYSSDFWLDDTHIYIGAKDYQDGAESGSRAYALYILDRQTGQRVGRYEVPGHIFARPVANGDAVFFATDNHSRQIESGGTLYALSLHDLSHLQTLWEPLVVEQRFQSDLLLVKDRLIAGTRQGAVYAVLRQSIESPESPSIYAQQEEWENAAIAYALQGNFVQAAQIYAQQLGQPYLAGQLYLQANDPHQTIALLGRSENETERSLAIQAALALSDLRDRAGVLRDLGVYLDAARAYREAGDEIAAGDCYQEAQEWDQARLAYKNAKAWDKWGKVTRDLKLWNDLVDRYLETGEYSAAAEIYAEELGQFLEAANCYDRANLADKALVAFRRVDLAKMPEPARHRMAELAIEQDEIELALEVYRSLGETKKAAELAETSQYYRQALALYQELGSRLKVAEMQEKLTQYVQSADIFIQEGMWQRAAENFERQVEQELERIGGVRFARRNEQLQEWLLRAIELFEDEGEYAETKKQQDYFYRSARRCRNKLAQLKREPLMKISLQTDHLSVDENSVVQCVVENIGWGTVKNLILSVNSAHLKFPVNPLFLGDLPHKGQVEKQFVITPHIAGAIELQIELRGQTRRGEPRQFSIEGGHNIIIDTQSATADEPHHHAEEGGLSPLWHDSTPSGSSEPGDEGPVSQIELIRGETKSLRQRLVQHSGNLNKLKEQAATFGAGQAPLKLLNDMEAEEKAIDKIKKRLRELES